MFSGLIGHTGRVVANEEVHGGRHLVIEAPHAIDDGIEPKDSICVNGVCLTAAKVGRARIAFDVVPETLACSTLGDLDDGEHVNLELSLKLGDRLGGHLVYGHIDATAEVLERAPEGQGERLTVAIPAALKRYIVPKGYVALDGISLTVASVDGDRFTIALIPETIARTTLSAAKPGRKVNLEIDPIARYALAEG
ncbi:MAG: riboflavin synthase [Candidatus Eremiobacteraeota bacterium]|nr:riboflavin synthase [Candidatus Eremiobacteraeota bacterium]